MKLLLVDDHGLFREGLGLLMQQMPMATGPDDPAPTVLEAGSLQDALTLARVHPDLRLAFLDLRLPDAQGLESIQRWRQACPQVPAVVLSADDRVDTVISAIDAGAVGFIPKTARSADMRRALAQVLSGGVYLPDLPDAPTLSGGHGHEVPDHGEESLSLGLSERQLEVLSLLVEGQANKDICRVLGLSDSTVKTHLAAIFRKLGVNTRTQAVVAVARLNLKLPPSWRLSRSE
jgi:DNA-binding NarL/FixJ family response regulator